MSLSDSNTVFVTGGSGFIGTNLVQELVRRGKRVRCLVRQNSRRESLKKCGVDFIEGSVSELKSLEEGMTGASVVYHLAGTVRASSVKAFRKVNRLGCQNVAQAAVTVANRTGKAPKIVSVSSLAAAGPGPMEKDATSKSAVTRPKRETDLPNPYSPYGISKLDGENELIRYADELPISIVRPAIVFGPRDCHGFPLFKMAYQGVFWVPGWYDQEFSYICVKDLVNILIAAAERGKNLTVSSLKPLDDSGSIKQEGARCTGEGIYFAAHPNRLRFSVYGQKLGQALGYESIWTPHCPPAAVLVAGILMECIRLLTHYDVLFDWNKARESLWGPWICEPTKSETELHYSFDTPLETQFKETADWYFDNGFFPSQKKSKNDMNTQREG